MLFNSISFAFFLPVVFILYWFITNRSLKIQNILLLIASYFFYACWDWRFLFLLIFSTLLDFYSGKKIENAPNKQQKKIWLWLSIIINLGFLCVFKYYNFFVESFVEALSCFGIKASPWTLKIILPIGISFYTFHGLSYIIDVYKEKIKAEFNFIDYAVFVSFFPLLVAGPIERATHLLPQIKKPRTFTYENAVEGTRQILWGLVKKIVIADQCGEYANMVFNHSSEYSGSSLVIGAICFSIQIYGDFSGYSDIALGTARLFGIELLRNFAYPYFSRDIAEFWRRWHISLSSWFKDYLYIPLGGSKGGIWLKIRNAFIVFLVSGFWHGANWTFIFWGILNAIYMIPSILLNKNRNHLDIVAQNKMLPNYKEVLSILITFCLTTFAWIFFRAENLNHAFSIISNILSTSLFIAPAILIKKKIILVVLIFFIIEWIGRHKAFAISHLETKLSKPIRWAFYYVLVLSIMYFVGPEQQFIYFQF